MSDDAFLQQRFGLGAPLSEIEREFVDLMRTELSALALVHGASPDEWLVGDLGESARTLAKDLQRLGVAAYREGEMAGALAAFALCLRCRLRFSSTRVRATVTAVRHWALAMREAGEYDAAAGAFQFVLDRLSTVSEGDAERLDTKNDMATVLLDQGHHDAAIVVLRELVALNKRLRSGRAKSPHTLTAESNLAEALKMSGDYRGARALAERVLGDRQASPALGPDHPDTLASANNLAEVLQRLGDLPGALRLQQDVLERRQASQPNHPDTVTAAANLATTIYQLGEWRRAAEIEREVLRDRTAQFGEGHPDTLTAANNLSGSLRELGEFTEARVLLQGVVKQRRKSFGERHNDTLMAMTNLADLLREEGDLAAAGRQAMRAWRIRKEVLPENHHDTLTSMSSHAAILHASGKHAQALRLQQQLLEIRRRDAGPLHFDTLLAINDLGSMLSKIGRWAEARSLYEEVDAAASRSLGSSHPDTIEARLNLSEVHYELGDRDTSLQVAQSVVEYLQSREILDARDFQRAARLVGLLYMLEANAQLGGLFVRISGRMRTTMELLNLESAHRILSGFQAFHDTWLRFCMAHAPNEILLAMAPLHGIEATAWVLAELGRERGLGALTGHDARAAFSDARQVLADRRIQLQQVDSELRMVEHLIALHGKGDGRLVRIRTQLRSQQVEVSKQERLDMATYRSARAALEATDPALRATLSDTSPTAAEIRNQLDDGEAALFLLQLTDSYCAALLLRRSGHKLVGLPEMETMRTAFHAYEASFRGSGRAMSLRDRADPAVPPELPSIVATSAASARTHLAALDAAVRSAFWEPLGAELQGVARLHVVYAPSLRGFALELANPGLNSGYYPSLSGFLRVFASTRKAPVRPIAALDVGMDCAWGAPVPIPFVMAEAMLLQSIVPRGRVHEGSRMATVLHSGAHATAVQVACHGAMSGELDSRHAVLLLDWASTVRLDPANVASLPGRIDEFFCSTCVGGVVSERVATDAIGIVSALQVKGVAGIVACLAPVPDFHMPLLAAFYWHERLQGDMPAQALRTAKRYVLTGQWPLSLVPIVEGSYRTTMEEVLKRAQYVGPELGDPASSADRAYRIAQSVEGWVLPDALRRDLRGDAEAMTSAQHRVFSRKWCETSGQRGQFAALASSELVRRRAELPPEHAAQIAHLCSFTMCFGGTA